MLDEKGACVVKIAKMIDVTVGRFRHLDLIKVVPFSMEIGLLQIGMPGIL